MNVYIVTGSTRGMGQALAKAILAYGDHLLSLSSAPDQISEQWVNVQCDLSRPDTVNACLEKLLADGLPLAVDDLVLINNAGVLHPMGPIDQLPGNEIHYHLMVNQMAPALLMSAFIHLTRRFECARRIINISSGAARYPYAGWSIYCANKAALEMMTLCVAQEQARAAKPMVVCAVSPGKVETQMQEIIRNSSPELFPAQPDFVEAKTSGDLAHPDEVAGLLLSLDKARQFKNGCIYDLRQAIRQNGELHIEPLSSLLG